MSAQNPAPEDSKEPNSSTPPVKPVEPVNTNPAAEPATAEQLEQVEKQMSGFERATLKWAKVAVGMSALAAIFVCAQWYEMHQGGIDTHDLAVATGKQADALITSQRAFVTFSPDASIGTEVGPNRKVVSWQVHIPMKNESPSATREMRDCTNSVTIPRGPIQDSFQYPDTCEPRNAPLGPRSQISVIPKNIAIADVQSVQRKERSVYVYGWATYRDMFPHTPKHITLFCYELVLNTINADLTDIGYNAPGTFFLCPHHNCQDEDCAGEVLPQGFQPN